MTNNNSEDKSSDDSLNNTSTDENNTSNLDTSKNDQETNEVKNFSAYITHINTSDIGLSIRVAIDKVAIEGTCELTVGDYKETVDIIHNPQDSSCEGFDVLSYNLASNEDKIKIKINTNLGNLELNDKIK